MPRSDGVRNRGMTLEQRFWLKVAQTDTCWIWLGAKNKSGHGVIGIGGRRMDGAHRVSYEISVGPIPDGLHIDHICEHPWCVNPAHLEPVTLWENLARSPRTPAVINTAKVECLRGHPFDDLNTYRDRSGRRHCRACGAERHRSRKASNR